MPARQGSRVGKTEVYFRGKRVSFHGGLLKTGGHRDHRRTLDTLAPFLSLSVTFSLIAGGVLVSLWKTRGEAAGT
jgi:hypothetical protein